MKKLLLRSALVFCCLLSISKTAFAQVDLYLDSINVYVNAYGKIQIYSLPDTIGQLTRMSPLVGTGSSSVFDDRQDLDTEDPTQLIANPKLSDVEIYGSYNNNYSGLPPNVLVKENIYCWQHQNSIVVKYTVINRETSPMNEIFGLELIPEVSGQSAGTDTVIYNSQSKILSDWKTEGVAFKYLSGNMNALKMFVYYSGYAADSSFWSWMTSGKLDSLLITDPNDPNVDDPVMIPAFNSKTLAVGDSAIYYVSVGYGKNKNVLLSNMMLADKKYNLITSVESNTNYIPLNYNLSQNYPNPFNPSTKIAYQIPKSGHVTLKVYDTIGKEVATLVNADKTAGNYVVDFNGLGLSSGIYFYSIQSGSFHQTQKMILLK
jgi:hypothetical protein